MPRSKEAFEAMRQTTRAKIETAALSLFARKGLAVKVGEIAEAAGVSLEVAETVIERLKTKNSTETPETKGK